MSHSCREDILLSAKNSTTIRFVVCKLSWERMVIYCSQVLGNLQSSGWKSSSYLIWSSHWELLLSCIMMNAWGFNMTSSLFSHYIMELKQNEFADLIWQSSLKYMHAYLKASVRYITTCFSTVNNLQQKNCLKSYLRIITMTNLDAVKNNTKISFSFIYYCITNSAGLLKSLFIRVICFLCVNQ